MLDIDQLFELETAIENRRDPAETPDRFVRPDLARDAADTWKLQQVRNWIATQSKAASGQALRHGQGAIDSPR
ncbi:MAG: hypothetical protein EPO26_11120 [Chloroflexota bacterium]|nr:MAG: hypothetical protein EPO26_11120 [Chloroflexota bacterium]